MSNRRVVVTGLGMLSPLGLNVEDSWQAIKAGKSGVGPIEAFDVSQSRVKICASVKGFDASQYMTPKDMRKLSEFIQFGYVAAKEAIEDAGFDLEKINLDRFGVAIGSGIGGLKEIEHSQKILETDGPRKISPFFIPSAIINMVAGFVSMKYNLRGPNISIVTACTTGAHNIGHAARMIKYGDADIFAAGGTEMATTALGLGGFAAARALSTRNDEPEKASRPWDKDRDGFVLADGAGVIILEEYQHAKQRGAKIYAELTGFGMSADAYHMTLPDGTGEGFRRAMVNTLNDAGVNPADVNYINAHGTSTLAGDIVEVNAVKLAFGSDTKIAVSSTKSMTGHLLGAAGAVEAIFSILAIRDQIAPPTINLDHPDEGCDLDFVPHRAREMKIQHALSNSFGFGGTNGSLLFSKLK